MFGHVKPKFLPRHVAMLTGTAVSGTWLSRTGCFLIFLPITKLPSAAAPLPTDNQRNACSTVGLPGEKTHQSNHSSSSSLQVLTAWLRKDVCSFQQCDFLHLRCKRYLPLPRSQTDPLPSWSSHLSFTYFFFFVPFHSFLCHLLCRVWDMSWLSTPVEINLYETMCAATTFTVRWKIVNSITTHYFKINSFFKVALTCKYG